MEPVLEAGQPFGDDLGAKRGWRLESWGEVLGAAQADELGAVDVDHVQGDGDAGGASCLGHQLVGDQVGRHLVEYVCDLER